MHVKTSKRNIKYVLVHTFNILDKKCIYLLGFNYRALLELLDALLELYRKGVPFDLSDPDMSGYVSKIIKNYEDGRRIISSQSGRKAL